MDDADLELAVACALNGAFGGSGQKCTGLVTAGRP